MKKLMILVGFAVLLFGKVDIYNGKVMKNNIASAFADHGKSVIFVKKIKHIVPKNIKSTSELLNKATCNNKTLKEYINKGGKALYFYYSDSKAVLFEVTSCKN